MAPLETPDDPDRLQSPKDMRNWLHDEVWRVTKAAELQIKDATDFVTAYEAGDLTPEEADQRWGSYLRRWSESPLEAINPNEGLTDEEILHAIDRPDRGIPQHRWTAKEDKGSTGRRRP